MYDSLPPEPAPPDSTQALLARLAALTDAMGSALAGQMTGGRHLVDALSDQLAEGQVETLFTLTTAASAIRRQATELTQAVSGLITDVIARLEETQAAVDQRNADIAEQLEQTGINLSWVGTDVGTQLEAATASTATAIDALVASAVARIDQAARDAAGEIGVAAEDFVVGLAERLAALEERDAKLDRRAEARVQRLVERADASLAETTAAFAAEIERLQRRDAELEKQRADEFVRVLDEILSRAGARGKDLRERVRGVLERDRAKAPEPAAAPPPAPVPAPTEDDASPVRRSRRKAPDKESGT